ncbi:hypothetical protein BSV1_R38 (plasmid) [Borreliella finlandensis]|uniref:Uncharacterized protein n=1 Tax=Borreliella finlandensis TaxID=498741 RepID=A0A806C6R5_9SPIR|nr:hypothetical protein BSV1_R38 [Borreliella finlandensis]
MSIYKFYLKGILIPKYLSTLFAIKSFGPAPPIRSLLR